MSDRSDEFRKAAADCLALASTSTDPSIRLGLLTLGQQWLALAEGRPHADKTFDELLKEFNDWQMTQR
jgi:hypothetical protein